MTLKPFAIGISAIVLVIVIAGIYFAGSPKNARLMKLDNLRSEQISQISYAIDAYASVSNWTVPESLDQLRTSSLNMYYYGDGKDPVTHEAYEYLKLANDRFEVCAVFATDTTHESTGMYSYRGPVSGEFNPWLHTTGRVCFERAVVRPTMDAVNSEKKMAPVAVPVQ